MDDYQKGMADKFPHIGHLLRNVHPADQIKIGRVNDIFLQSAPRGSIEVGVFTSEGSQRVPSTSVPTQVADAEGIEAAYAYTGREGDVTLHYLRPMQ